MSYSSVVLGHAPESYLPMNETTGPFLADASGNNHQGSVVGGTNAVIGGATGFLVGEVGVDCHPTFSNIECDFGTAFPTMPAWTVDYWLQLSEGNVGNDFFFNLRGLTRWSHDLVQISATEVQLSSIFHPSGETINSGVITVPNFNCWHYWAISFDGLGTLCWYLDGALIATLTNGATSGIVIHPTTFQYTNDSGGGSSNVGLMQSAIYPAQLSVGDIAALYAAATPRQDAGCFAPPLRLRHASGHVVFESSDTVTALRAANADALTHDGTTMSVLSDGVSKLVVPIPTAPSPPTRWVGIDPSGGVAVHDILPVTATHSISPVVPPVPPATTPTTCDQMRCGAATNMTGHLISLYVHWAGVLNPLSSIAIKFGVGAAIAAAGELVASAFALEELAASILESITSKLTSLLSAATIGLFDSPTPDETVVIVNGAYCALTCDGNVINPTAAQIQAWNDYLAAHSSSFSTLNMQLALFNALLQFTPLLDWQLQAQGAAPDLSCGSMTCP